MSNCSTFPPINVSIIGGSEGSVFPVHHRHVFTHFKFNRFLGIVNRNGHSDIYIHIQSRKIWRKKKMIIKHLTNRVQDMAKPVQKVVEESWHNNEDLKLGQWCKHQNNTKSSKKTLNQKWSLHSHILKTMSVFLYWKKKITIRNTTLYNVKKKVSRLVPVHFSPPRFTILNTESHSVAGVFSCRVYANLQADRSHQVSWLNHEPSVLN